MSSDEMEGDSDFELESGAETSDDDEDLGFMVQVDKDDEDSDEEAADVLGDAVEDRDEDDDDAPPADVVDPDGWYEEPYDEGAPEGPYTTTEAAWNSKVIGEGCRNDHLSALYHFRLFLTDAFVAKVLHGTNERGASRRGARWKPVTLPEFWRWLALVISMGIHQLPSLRHYWSIKRFGTCCAFLYVAFF